MLVLLVLLMVSFLLSFLLLWRCFLLKRCMFLAAFEGGWHCFGFFLGRLWLSEAGHFKACGAVRHGLRAFRPAFDDFAGTAFPVRVGVGVERVIELLFQFPGVAAASAQIDVVVFYSGKHWRYGLAVGGCFFLYLRKKHFNGRPFANIAIDFNGPFTFLDLCCGFAYLPGNIVVFAIVLRFAEYSIKTAGCHMF